MLLGPPGQPTTAVALRHNREILLQRALLLAQLGKREDSNRDIEVLMLSGGKQGILRVQLYLRRNGFPDVRIDGERDPDFDNTLRNCVLDRACGLHSAEISAPCVDRAAFTCEVGLQISEAAFRRGVPDRWRLGVCSGVKRGRNGSVALSHHVGTPPKAEVKCRRWSERRLHDQADVRRANPLAEA